MKRTWLVDARKEKGIKQQELAEMAQIAKSYLSEIENGNRTPSGHTALRISKIIDVPMEKFFEDETESKAV
jgi:putative transcriptional regulator